MSIESFKGKVLEEVIAYLIRNAGYQLLVDPSQDDVELRKEGHGLLVKGRGANHQVDVLGQLSWIPAFTFPIRLFVEAKWHAKRRTGLYEVRNAVGVLHDVNQNLTTISAGDDVPLRRFNYCYALFSTTGFSKRAEQMALAHLVSLIDLGGDEFSDVREAVNALAEALYPIVSAKDDQEEEGGDES